MPPAGVGVPAAELPMPAMGVLVPAAAVGSVLLWLPHAAPTTAAEIPNPETAAAVFRNRRLLMLPPLMLWLISLLAFSLTP